MSDEETMDIRESFIKRVWSWGYEVRKPVTELLTELQKIEAAQLCDGIQQWLDAEEAEREQ